jgi:phage-related protein
MPGGSYPSFTPKPLQFLAGEIKSPPFSNAARKEAGTLLRRVQRGQTLGLPHSRPLPRLGSHWHELRVKDEKVTWRIVYRIDPAAVLVCAVFAKKSRTLPKHVIDGCRQRFAAYDARGE